MSRLARPYLRQLWKLTATWVDNSKYWRLNLDNCRGPLGVQIVNSDELTEDQLAAISEVSESVTGNGRNFKFKLHDWQAARDCIERGLPASPQEHRLLICRALIEYETGDFKQGEAYLENFLEVMRSVGPMPTPAYVFPIMVLPMIARITGSVNRLEVAEAAAEATLSASDTNSDTCCDSFL